MIGGVCKGFAIARVRFCGSVMVRRGGRIPENVDVGKRLMLIGGVGSI